MLNKCHQSCAGDSGNHSQKKGRDRCVLTTEEVPTSLGLEKTCPWECLGAETGQPRLQIQSASGACRGGLAPWKCSRRLVSGVQKIIVRGLRGGWGRLIRGVLARAGGGWELPAGALTLAFGAGKATLGSPGGLHEPTAPYTVGWRGRPDPSSSPGPVTEGLPLAGPVVQRPVLSHLPRPPPCTLSAPQGGGERGPRYLHLKLPWAEDRPSTLGTLGDTV